MIECEGPDKCGFDAMLLADTDKQIIYPQVFYYCMGHFRLGYLNRLHVSLSLSLCVMLSHNNYHFVSFHVTVSNLCMSDSPSMIHPVL